MKSKILLPFFLLASFVAKAQIYFDANAGINISNFKTKVNGKDDGFKSSPGYSIAANVNIPLNTNLLLQTGLQYESYHTKVNSTFSSNEGGETYTETLSGKSHAEFLNIPVKLIYKVNAGNNYFLLGAGPYLGIGLSGHSTGTTTSERNTGSVIFRDTLKTDNPVKFGSAPGELKQMNFGIGLSVGYLLQNNMYFSIYTNLGLANLNNRQLSSTKAIAAGFTIGYVFGSKIKR